MTALRFLAMGLFACLAAHAELTSVELENNPEKRARLALDNADTALGRAQANYAHGNVDGTSDALAEVAHSVELAQSSLDLAGKSASRNPKQFKHGELKTRDLLRHLDGFAKSMDLADRKLIDPVIDKVQAIHDIWLNGIMSKKR